MASGTPRLRQAQASIGHGRPVRLLAHVPEPPLVRAAGALSIVAAAAHTVAAPEHLAEWWGYGLFFLFAAMAQFFFGLALLLDASGDPGLREAIAGKGPRSIPRLYAYGIAGNAAIVGLYAVTRTVGIPILGPDAGHIEPITVLGVLSKASEVLLIAALAVLLQRRARAHRSPPAATPAGDGR